MTTYSELVKRFREQNSKQSKTSWRYESWADSARDAQQVAERSQWMEKPLEPAPWDKPEVPWWEEKHEPAPWDEQKMAGLSESFPGTFTSYNDAVSDGFQGTREEWLQQQSIPQIERPLTGAQGGRVYDTRQYFKPGGIVEPGVTHYSKDDELVYDRETKRMRKARVGGKTRQKITKQTITELEKNLPEEIKIRRMKRPDGSLYYQYLLHLKHFQE